MMIISLGTKTSATDEQSKVGDRYRVVILQPDGLCNAFYSPDPLKLERLQELVGGMIEYAVMPDSCGFDMIVNEEGKLRNMPYNTLASLMYQGLWFGAHDESELNFGMMHLVGPVVLLFSPKGKRE